MRDGFDRIGGWRRVFPAMAVAAVLAGCDGLGDGQGAGFGFAPRQPDPPVAGAPAPRAELLGGRIVLTAPRGYCIDASTLRSRAGFALIASCWNLTDGKSGSPVEPAILTVSAERVPRGASLPDAETLAQSIGLGTPSAVREGDLVTLIRLDTGGQEALAGGDPRHWRGAMLQGNWVVMLAVYAPKGGAATGALGGDLLETLAANIRRDSPQQAVPTAGPAAPASPAAPDTEATQNTPPPATATATAETARPGLGAAIRRLFN